MADDELSAPLGQSAKKKRRRFSIPIRVPHLVVAGLGLFVLTFAVWALVVDDPLGGEPIAVVATGFDAPKMPPAVVSARGRALLQRPGCARRSGTQGGVGAGRTAIAGAAIAAAERQDRHHHRRLDRATPGGGDPGLARRPRPAGAKAPGGLAPRSDPAHRRRRCPSVRGLRPRRQGGSGPEGRPEDRHRARRPRRQRQRHRSGDQQAARSGDLRLHAVWRRCREPCDQGPRRRPRTPSASADGAVRLSRQRPRPADAAQHAQSSNRTSIA